MNSFIIEKSQEICFAVMRVSAHIRRVEFRHNLERLSYKLLDSVSFSESELAIATIAAMRNFVVFGKNIFEIEPLNAKVLDRELEQLSNEVKRFAGIDSLPDLESIFTRKLDVRRSVAPQKEVLKAKKAPDREIVDKVNPAIRQSGNNTETAISDEQSAEIRKEKIYIMLSTAAEKRLALKDIVAAFPEVSERTIRYDLKKLFRQGRIERQGSGGPSNYYMVRPVSLSQPVINLPATSL